MTHTPCVVAHPVPGRHADACTAQNCPGCLPALATTGLLVCSWHERRVRGGLRDLPGLWADLGDPRKSTQPGSGRGGDSGGSPMLISDTRRAARSAIRALLVSWCLVLTDDYALTTPPDTIRGMAHHVAVQAGRLLASHHADQLCHDIDTATREAWRLARPGHHRGIRVACPTCGHRVALRPDDHGDVRCTECGEHGDIRWWRAQLAPKVDEPMPAGEIITWMVEHHRIVGITEANLRVMATRHQITRAGRDDLGRTLYDPVEVAAVLIERRARTA